MRYLCLGYYDPTAFEALSAEERLATAKECAPHDAELRASGRLLSVASLEHGVHVALRPGESGTSVTDGPYAEAKELVGSFFIVEADDLNEAVRIASLHPAARVRPDLGFGIEVRPIEILGEADPESGELRLVQGSPPDGYGG
ncbi:MAG: YciI family protein [Gemmatimonadota bacterium]